MGHDAIKELNRYLHPGFQFTLRLEVYNTLIIILPYTSKYLLRRYLDSPNPPTPNTSEGTVLGALEP